MTFLDVMQKLSEGESAGWGIVGVFIVLLSLIQISPLKLNPWDRLFGWLGRKLNGDVEKETRDQRPAEAGAGSLDQQPQAEYPGFRQGMQVGDGTLCGRVEPYPEPL